ncbi:MAG TPA: DUF4190 domain-containing protein [Mycobacterium sp.]|nr:DUF4190 domain-containing protein [Mycobacterium sp.]
MNTMTAPGGGFGESGHDDKADSPAGSGAGEQPDATAPWQPPAAPLPAESAPPLYPPPSPDYASGYPQSYPPPVAPPPGYEQPPGYGAPAYPPPPPPYGGPPTYGPPAYPGGYYPTPDYQGGYYPTPDYQGGYGSAPPQKPGTNALAIASLISSFTGLLCCIGSIVAIVLGAIAVRQIKRTGQDGFGLAVAGIVIGIATLGVTLVFLLFAMHTR